MSTCCWDWRDSLWRLAAAFGHRSRSSPGSEMTDVCCSQRFSSDAQQFAVRALALQMTGRPGIDPKIAVLFTGTLPKRLKRCVHAKGRQPSLQTFSLLPPSRASSCGLVVVEPGFSNSFGLGEQSYILCIKSSFATKISADEKDTCSNGLIPISL